MNTQERCRVKNLTFLGVTEVFLLYSGERQQTASANGKRNSPVYVRFVRGERASVGGGFDLFGGKGNKLFRVVIHAVIPCTLQIFTGRNASIVFTLMSF